MGVRKRVVAQDSCMGAFNTVLSFYDIFGQRIATASCGPGNYCAAATAEVYFGAKLVKSNGVTVVTDRLGSVRGNASGDRFSYLPYGEERTASTNARVKFGTYLQDASDQDYADQRYYNPWFGRFNTPDPSSAGSPSDPASWNKYAYVEADPINNHDPSGLILCNPDFCKSPPIYFGGSGGSFGLNDQGVLKPINDKDPPWQDEWDNLSTDCQNGLKTAIPKTGTVDMLKALNRAVANSGTLETAAWANGIDPALLAAIAIEESGFRTKDQENGGNGRGVFQIDIGVNKSVTESQANNLSFAANSAANYLSTNMAVLAAKLPNFTPDQLLQATAASYNFGITNISGNPDTIDVGTKNVITGAPQ
jgi:RHS repeat-associated protein